MKATLHPQKPDPPEGRSPCPSATQLPAGGLTMQAHSKQNDIYCLAHSSRDVAQGLVQITNVLDTMLATRSATPSELGVGDTEESSSLSSLAVPMMDPRRRSARHSTACEPDTRGAGEATAHSSGMRGRKK
ncbi:hypothetical protein NDU88_004282 [Pleurodeles waltl]|uniref:Uncharacterized protein n=1 Tax=Pleurodeles waltl TaxID=8319 RepID=A0AAV7SIF9_PLEWA|nr:hypothetical protein NDU88_004282 [Pleurodeles waltl]